MEIQSIGLNLSGTAPLSYNRPVSRNGAPGNPPPPPPSSSQLGASNGQSPYAVGSQDAIQTALQMVPQNQQQSISQELDSLNQDQKWQLAGELDKLQRNRPATASVPDGQQTGNMMQQMIAKVKQPVNQQQTQPGLLVNLTA